VYGILVIISANIMFGLRKNSSIALFISIGFLVSVAIYYISFFFVSLGNNGTIPSSLSIIFPIIIFTIISIINLLNINEK
jgi:lipopolysaccharide export LptBFGC system permease protein LptF